MGPRSGPSSGNVSRTPSEASHGAPAAVLAEALVNTDALHADRQPEAIVVIEKRPLIRDCLVKCLTEIDLGYAVLAFGTVPEWLESATRYRPLLILFSLHPDNTDDFEIRQNLSLLNGNNAGAPVVVISDSEDTSQVISALKSGARGYIPTSVTLNVALEAMRLVGAGGTFAPTSALLDTKEPRDAAPLRHDVGKNVLFTARQLAVLVALRRGKANKQIAYELNMREGTVKVHVRHIMKKLRARNRTEVAVIANELCATPAGTS
ncbi:MAG: LuxR C-terminal-related transcriptional regulator [Pseudomonadota bacterium]